MRRMFSLSNVKRKVLAGLTTALLMFGAVGIGEAQLYDATSDFSINNGNPNGVWSYGWMPTDFSTFNLYASCMFYGPNSFSIWYRTGSADEYPNILRNDGSNTINGVASVQLALHPSSTFEASVLRWTAPSGGLFRINGQFFSGDVGSMQVGIRHGSDWLWQGVDSGIFNFDISVAAGESIDFLVWGGYGNGSTPLELRISSVIMDLMTKYYNDILDRAPEPGEAEAWTAEIERIVSLGVDIKEGFIAVGKVFFNSQEYLSYGKTDTAYILDLYRTFLNRIPAQFEVDSWLGVLTQGVSRNVVLNFFVFSPEFNTYMEGIFGLSTARPENNLVNDFYRGILSRLPDTMGFNYWLGLVRTAQCTGAQQVRDLSYQIASLFVGSAEYVLRGRTDSEYVGDLYDAILRRGALPPEVSYWETFLNTATREETLPYFTNSQEFQIRVMEVTEAQSTFDCGGWRLKIGKGSPQFRAIGGVSMGAYGAMNIGLGRPNFFNTIASLGGPLDMAYMLKFLEVDMLGNYDNPSIYPNRDTLIDMLKDLTISFGNPVYYNPLSTYYPPGITAQNARIPTTLLNFKDGELNPNGSRPVITYEDPGPGDWVEVLLALDSNGNGKRDLGEPTLKQFQEPFIDKNGNGMFDPGEPFSDTGLDGVWGTGDYGEGDGEFTYNPNHDNFMAEDPLTRANTLPLATLQNLNLYIDAGTQDEFQFNINAENFVQTLFGRSLNFRVENGFLENFPRVSHFNEKRVYIRYPGGHVGFNKENIGLSFEQAKQGIEEAIVVANRFTTLFSFVSDHFTGGDFGTNLLELLWYPSKMEVAYFTSSSLNRTMKFGIYLPPGYSRSITNYYPVFYLLLGYNMSVDGMTNSWIKTVLDGLILNGEMQKMIIVIPDGFNYKNGRGHFFVNQVDQERGDNFKYYFFDLVTFIDTYYKTK